MATRLVTETIKVPVSRVMPGDLLVASNLVVCETEVIITSREQSCVFHGFKPAGNDVMSPATVILRLDSNVTVMTMRKEIF